VIEWWARFALPTLRIPLHAENHHHRTGVVSPANRARHGTFPQMFERLLGEADPSASFTTIRLADGEALPDPATLEAILLTGSPAGVYDDLDWIAPLERFVRTAYDARTPMAGVCFGHQLIAQALGERCANPRRAGAIGRHVYDIAPGNGVIDGRDNRNRRFASGPGHRAARRRDNGFPSEFTPHAGLLYANGTALSCSRIPNSRYPLRISVARKPAKTTPPKRGRNRQGLAEQPLDSRRPRPRDRALLARRAQCDPFRAGHQRVKRSP